MTNNIWFKHIETGLQNCHIEMANCVVFKKFRALSKNQKKNLQNLTCTKISSMLFLLFVTLLISLNHFAVQIWHWYEKVVIEVDFVD